MPEHTVSKYITLCLEGCVLEISHCWQIMGGDQTLNTAPMRDPYAVSWMLDITRHHPLIPDQNTNYCIIVNNKVSHSVSWRTIPFSTLVDPDRTLVCLGHVTPRLLIIIATDPYSQIRKLRQHTICCVILIFNMPHYSTQFTCRST